MADNPVFGIDHGNGNMKTKENIFACGFVKLANKPSRAFSEDVLEYNNSYYVLSDTRLPYKLDKTNDINYFILTLFAIAKEAESRNKALVGKDIILSIGLPPAHFALQEKKFKEYIMNNAKHGVSFKYNDKSFQFYIKKCYVFPQNYAAIVTQKGELLRKYKTVYSVDIGDGTVDVLTIKNGKPDVNTCVSLEEGNAKMRDKIINQITNDYGYTLDSDCIEQILAGENTVLPIKIVEQVNELVQEWTQSLFDKLHVAVPDFRINPTVLSGGGSITLKSNINKLELLGMKEYIEDIKANAIGYEIIAEKFEIKAG